MAFFAFFLKEDMKPRLAIVLGFVDVPLLLLGPWGACWGSLRRVRSRLFSFGCCCVPGDVPWVAARLRRAVVGAQGSARSRSPCPGRVAGTCGVGGAAGFWGAPSHSAGDLRRGDAD